MTDSPKPEVIDTKRLLDNHSIESLVTYGEIKDHRITTLAIRVIGLVAFVSRLRTH